jgi:hypothetical protein
MKKPVIERKRALVAHHPSAEVAGPGDRALHPPPPTGAPQHPAVLGGGLSANGRMRRDQLDPRLCPPFA